MTWLLRTAVALAAAVTALLPAAAGAQVGHEPRLWPEPARAGCAGPGVARRSALLLLRGDRVIASGFVFGDRRTVVTAEHVLAAGVDRAEDRRGRSYRLEPVAVDERRDLAVMRLDRDAEVLPLQPADGAWVGMEVFVIGHPRVLPGRLRALTRWAVARGVITGANDDWIVADAVVYRGNSGGPVVDCRGAVVGVASHGPGDLRMVAAARVHHVARLRDGGDQPRYRLPVTPGPGADIGLLVGDERLGASFAMSYQSAQHWFVQARGEVSTSSMTGDVFGDGLSTRRGGGLLAGLAVRPVRGWRYPALRVALALGVVVEHETRSRPVLAPDGRIESSADERWTAWGAMAARLAWQPWFAEPQLRLSLDSSTIFEWLLVTGLRLDL